VKQANVAIRALRRDDLDAFAAWGRYDDPVFHHYSPRALARHEGDALWRELAGTPEVRRGYAGLVDGEFVAALVVRELDASGEGSGEVGIALHPAYVGRGLGPRILRALSTVLAAEGIRRLRLEVVGFNRRAIGAYEGAGYVKTGERWGEAEPGIDFPTLISSPAGEVVRRHVRRSSDGSYTVRIVRMERAPEPPTE
jgi:RimJ/RimL family protein N-acetyltransferase